MMTRLTLGMALGLALLVCTPAARAAPAITIGVQAWNTQLSGNVHDTQDPLATNIGLRDDLGMGRHWNPNFVFAFTTPGFFPDVRLEYGTLIGNGSNSGHRELCYNGVNYEANGRLVSQAAIKQGRILFYWNPLDNEVVNLRAGLDLRWVSLNLAATGTATVSTQVSPQCQGSPVGGGQTQTFQKSTSTGVVSWLPAVNLDLIVHLPAHFDLYLKGSGLPYASSYIYDFRVGFKYYFGSGLSVGAGYRRWRLHLDNDSITVNGDLDFKGPYAGLYWSF